MGKSITLYVLAGPLDAPEQQAVAAFAVNSERALHNQLFEARESGRQNDSIWVSDLYPNTRSGELEIFCDRFGGPVHAIPMSVFAGIRSRHDHTNAILQNILRTWPAGRVVPYFW